MKKPLKQLAVMALVYAGLALAVIAMISLFRFGSFLAFFALFPLMESKLVGLGFNNFVATLLAILPAVFGTLAIGWFFSFNAESRKRAKWVFVSMGLFYVAFTAFVEKDQMFSPQSGEAKVCYALGVNNRYENVPCEWNFHPETRNPVLKNPEKIRQVVFGESVKENGLPSVAHVAPSLQSALFDSAGNPLLWYYRYADGRLEFFARAGKHPRLGLDLLPVDPQIALQLDEMIRQGKTEMIIGWNSSADTRLASNAPANAKALAALSAWLEMEKSRN